MTSSESVAVTVLTALIGDDNPDSLPDDAEILCTVGDVRKALSALGDVTTEWGLRYCNADGTNDDQWPDPRDPEAGKEQIIRSFIRTMRESGVDSVELIERTVIATPWRKATP